MLIPTLSPSSINSADLEDLMRVGFGYVKLPDVGLVAKIKTCVEVARKFFQEPTAAKERWKLKETLQKGDRYEGYVLRAQSKNTNRIEQIFFEPDVAFGPYEKYAALVEDINHTFINLICVPLLHAIFTQLQLSQDNFNEATTQPTCSLVFQSFTSIGETKDVIRLKAHKDFGLITVLFFEEPGLEVKYQNEWTAIPPQPGCVVVNLGNALELMTGKRCYSALHRVTNATDNRLSMVYFVNPNYQQPVRNYVDNSLISATGELFFKQQFTEYFETDH